MDSVEGLYMKFALDVLKENYEDWHREYDENMKVQEIIRKREQRRIKCQSKIIINAQTSNIIKPLWDLIFFLTLVAEIILIPYT